MRLVRKPLLLPLLVAVLGCGGCQGLDYYTPGGASSLGATVPGTVHSSQYLDETIGTGGTPPGGLRGGPEPGSSEL